MKFTKLTAALAAVLFLSSCSEPAEPFEGIDPGKYLLCYYEYDGETVREAALAYGDSDPTAEILEKLRAADAEPSGKPEKPNVPVYGLEFLSLEEPIRSFAWSDGYLYADDGTVYEFGMDFPSLMAEYTLDWERESEVLLNELPCVYYLAKTADGWDTEFLRLEEDFVPAEELTVTLEEYTEEQITVTYEKHGLSSWSASPAYEIQVKLDGLWYEIPRLPGYWRQLGGDTAVLSGGLSETRTYSFVPYGKIPAGEYRIIADRDAACEFTVG